MCAPPFVTKQHPPIWKILDPPLGLDHIERDTNPPTHSTTMCRLIRHPLNFQLYCNVSIMFFKGMSVLSCGDIDAPVLDFLRHLPWVSKVEPLGCVLHCLHSMESSDLPLVQYLLTSSQPVWQLSHCDPHTYKQALPGFESEINRAAAS